MYDFPTKYLASAFVDAESVVYNADDSQALRELIGDPELAPRQVQQRSASGVKQRLGFEQVSKGILIVLQGNRFDTTALPTEPNASNMGGLSDYYEYAAEILVKSLEYFGRKAHRLAAVIEGLLPQMDVPEMEAIVERLFKLPQINHVQPFEWNWRTAWKVERSFADFSEMTNTLIDAKRARIMISHLGNIVQPEANRIGVSLDINTISENTAARFESDGIRAYFSEVSIWLNDLSSLTETFMMGK